MEEIRVVTRGTVATAAVVQQHGGSEFVRLSGNGDTPARALMQLADSLRGLADRAEEMARREG